MSEISHSDELVTKQDLSNFYQGILPYLGGMPDVVGGGFAPVGTIIAFMGTIAPQDYLACDGATYNIADYPQLTAFFNAQFGSVNKFGGDGVTTFKVPDLRGEFLRGSGVNGHTNQGNGSNVGTHQDGTIHSKAFADNTNITVTGKEAVTDWMGTYSGDSYNYYMYVKGTEHSSGSKTRFTSRPTNTSVLYCIKAIESGVVYSTEERIIGTWIDGKPLYQKTIDCGTLPNATAKTIQMGSNIKRVLNIKGYAFDGNYNVILPFLRVPITASAGSIAIMNVLPNSGTFQIVCDTDRSNYTESYVTLQYTKTTD